MTTVASTFAAQRSGERFAADHGWLKTFHSFSFADYFDPANVSWGALRVFNDDRIAGGRGFPTHPHQNMEIVTYVLSGKLEHRDTLGSHGIVNAGGVQYLSAGTGLSHSEYNALPDRELHFVQMWVIPGALDRAPAYGQLDFDDRERRDRWLTVASGVPECAAPIRLTQTATLRVCRVETTWVQHVFDVARFGFLFVASGAASIYALGSDGVRRTAALRSGDAVRTGGIESLDVAGTAELVLWDLPPLET